MKIIIFGIGDLAKTLYNYLLKSEEKNVIGFCVDDDYFEEEYFLGEKVYKLSDYPIEDNVYMITAIGYKNMRFKMNKYLDLKRKGIKFTNFIHPSSIIETENIGENNIVFPNVVIEDGVIIGNNNYIGTGTILSHDVKVKNHNFIAAGTLIGGFSEINENNFIGFHSTIIQNINIEKEVLIGANSLVLKNPKNFSKNLGVPCKEVANHKKNGIEL